MVFLKYYPKKNCFSQSIQQPETPAPVQDLEPPTPMPQEYEPSVGE